MVGSTDQLGGGPPVGGSEEPAELLTERLGRGSLTLDELGAIVQAIKAEYEFRSPYRRVLVDVLLKPGEAPVVLWRPARPMEPALRLRRQGRTLRP